MARIANDLAAFLRSVKESTPELIEQGQMPWVAPELLEEQEGFNLREYERPDTVAHIERLSRAYESGAQMPPLSVKIIDGRAYVRDGHCRLRAVKLAISRGCRIRRLPIIEMNGNELNSDIQLLTSNDGLKLTPLQRARGLARLRSHGLSVEEIAKHVGLSGTAVRDLIKLLDAPLDLQRQIEQEIVSATNAMRFWRQHGNNAGKVIQQAYDKQIALMGDGTQQTDNEGGERTTSNKPRVTKAHLNPAGVSKKVAKQFLKTFNQNISAVSQHLRDSAKVLANGELVSVKLPANVYEQLLALASSVQHETVPEETPAA